MKRRFLHYLALFGLMAMFTAAYALATHESTTETHVFPGTTVSGDWGTLEINPRTVTDQDPIPHEEEPAGTTVFFTSDAICNQPLSNYGPLPVTFEVSIPNSNRGLNGDVRLMSGCTGDGTPATDLILHVNGNGGNLGSADDSIVLIGVHDLQIEGYANCGAPAPEAHPDGIQMNSAHRITFRSFEMGFVDDPDPMEWVPTCHGAGGLFYVSALFNNKANLTEVVCEGCKMAGSTDFGPVGTGLHLGASTDSGAINSTFAARRPCFTETNANFPIRPVDVNNTCVDTG